MRDYLEDLEYNQDGTLKETDRGMKTKLTKERSAKIIEAVRKGNFLSVAAGAAGISRVTLMHWLKAGEMTNSGTYHDFFISLRAAQKEAEANHVRNITDKSQEDWKASAWYLERKHHERWGKQDSVGVKLSGGVDVRQKTIEEVLGEYSDILREGETKG